MSTGRKPIFKFTHRFNEDKGLLRTVAFLFVVVESSTIKKLKSGQAPHVSLFQVTSILNISHDVIQLL